MNSAVVFISAKHIKKAWSRIVNERKVDNEDGAYDLEFKGEPIRAQVKKENGEIIKTKEKTAQSVKTRLAILAAKSEGGIRCDLREIVRRIVTV